MPGQKRKHRSASRSLLGVLWGFSLVRVMVTWLSVAGLLALGALWATYRLTGSIASTPARVLWPVLFVGGLVVAAWATIAYRRRRRMRVKELGALLVLSPHHFEERMCDLLKDLGYREVERTGRPGDIAADITCKDHKGKAVVVQCKRHAPGIKVSSGEVQSFIGMMAIHHEADAGIFITTSEFTAPAAELAHRHNVQLWDGVSLSRLIGRVA